MISSADAALLMSGYKSESKSLKIIFSARDTSFSFSLAATVLEFVQGESLSLGGANTADNCWVSLRGCLFGYADIREAPSSVHETFDKYAGTLKILFPSGESLVLFELAEI